MDLNRPNIMYYIKEDSVLTPYEEYYAGSYAPGSTVNFEVQIWNNRFGTTDVGDAYNPRVILFFDSIENTVLLNYCTVTVDGSQLPIVMELDKGRIDIGRNLSGKANSASASKDNFTDVQVKIGPLPSGLRNELKNLFIDIEYDLEGGV
jgi:hypothetical protein